MPPGRTVTVGRHEFLVREAGPEDGPVLVLLHGWAYGSTGTWHGIVARLGDRFRVVTVDHRNHEKSDRIQGRYSIDDAADEVAGALLAAGVRGPVTVAGYSMGGLIAQTLARRYPALVGRLVLGATGARPIPIRRLATLGVFAVGRAMGRVGSTGWLRASYHYLMRVGAFEPRYGRWLWESLLNRDVNLYFEAGSAIWRFDSRDWIGRLAVPSLVIIPTDDQLVPPPAQYELASLLRDAEVVELVGARHEAVLTHTDEIAKSIARFAG